MPMTSLIRTLLLSLLLASCQTAAEHTDRQPTSLATEGTIEFDEAQIIAAADDYLLQPPVPITSDSSARSAGGIHDFYSEGDYWWPDPENPEGPYVRRDGKTNPDNFTAHRKAMRNLNKWVAGLVAAYEITGDEKYARHAITHLNAFFLDPATLMIPHLLYAQAIKGKVTGRGIGIIDTIHLIEVAKAIEKLAANKQLSDEKLSGLQKWFEDYATWMNTHEYGLAEKDHGNNHSTWWAAQLAAFAHLTEREDLLEVARGQFKKLLSAQMDADGTFPEEMGRTKPYNYTLFNLEGYAVLCELASTETDNLWVYEGANGSIRKAWEFMLPYVADKGSWMKPPDIQHFDQLPIQTTGLLLAALAYTNAGYFEVWKQLDPTRKSDEVNRNFPIREPVLWVK